MSQMNRLRLSLMSLALIVPLLAASPAFGQDPVHLNLTAEPQLIRFSTPAGDVLDWRLEVTNQQDQPVFDSEFSLGNALAWELVDSHGQAVESGIYNYTLSIRGGGPQRTRRGQLLVQKTSNGYQVSAMTDAQSALAANGETTLTVSSATGAAAEPGAVGQGTGGNAGLPTHLGSASFAQASGYISGTGTTSSMTKWIDGPGGVVGDTNVTELNGAMVIGNGTFRGNVHIFGPADKDVFAGMGPNIITGPAFNYGYAGESFGRSAGFFNVRPDAFAVAPNPSLRFATANVERMIITNTGNVGIGTTNPDAKLSITATGNGARVLHLGTERAWVFKQLGTGAGTALELTGADPSNNNKHFVINTDGNVGIGTTSPQGKLHVSGASSIFDHRVGIGITNPGAMLDATSADGTVALLGTGPNRAVIGRLGNISCPAPSSFAGPGAYGVGGCGGTTGSGVMGRTSASLDFRHAAVYAISEGGGLIFQGLAGTTAKASIDADGNLSLAGSVSQNSDVRLKQGVGNLGYGLREVLQLRPVTWTWKQQPERGMQLGLIAQEVETVLPELVSAAIDEERTKVLNYIGVVPVVIKAIQEQQTTIATLQAENAALTARLQALEQALQELVKKEQREEAQKGKLQKEQ